MKILHHWKAILAVVLVFIAGGITGSIATGIHLKRAFERGFKVENWTADAMKDLQKDLNLSPGQQPKIRLILNTAGLQLSGNFGRAINESGTNLVASWKEIAKELTPEQQIAFQRKCLKFREGVKHALKIELPPQ